MKYGRLPKYGLMRYSVKANGNKKTKISEPGTCCLHCDCEFSHQVRNDLLTFHIAHKRGRLKDPCFFAETRDRLMVCFPRSLSTCRAIQCQGRLCFGPWPRTSSRCLPQQIRLCRRSPSLCWCGSRTPNSVHVRNEPTPVVYFACTSSL